MAVIVKYVVEREGEEKMTFTSKAEADAYDRMLDMADAMFDLIGESELVDDEEKREALSLYLAQHKDSVLEVLGAKRKAAKKKPAKSENKADESRDDKDADAA
ncbi:multidrug DMT transporter permease [Salinivibrio sp. ML198]|uniref:YebG family protein n=1 Tax=Salinivibrio sp. ML198 TaxID=1909458 RepID=UPI000988AD61|nr:YebG family protein [Salinivibrio sp. ML198]OOE79028.1 multidrug DMT transporter permease [Salinivibrio sp. ML198]